MNTILVIEDNLELRENTAELLELNGYKVITAINGKSGFELAKKNRPDVVICDLMMPDTDGLGFLQLVKADSTLEDIPMIFFSAGSAPPALSKFVLYDHTYYLRKPFTKEELYEAVAKSINVH